MAYFTYNYFDYAFLWGKKYIFPVSTDVYFFFIINIKQFMYELFIIMAWLPSYHTLFLKL